MSPTNVLAELSLELEPELRRVAQLEARRGLVRSDLLGVGCLPPHLAQADAELLAVHLAELSSVLAAAARLALSGTRGRAQQACDLALRCSEARRLLALDGIVPSATLALALEAVSEPCQRRWPAALELATLAVALRPSSRARSALALAFAARGEWRAACAVALAALSRPRTAAVRRRWLARLCLWLERLGDSGRAALLRA